MKQIQESQEGSGDPKEMMYVLRCLYVVQSKQQHQCRSRSDQQQLYLVILASIFATIY